MNKLNDYEAYCKAYEEKCDRCLNKGILKNGQFCDCNVGMSERLMGVSAEADKLLES